MRQRSQDGVFLSEKAVEHEAQLWEPLLHTPCVRKPGRMDDDGQSKGSRELSWARERQAGHGSTRLGTGEPGSAAGRVCEEGRRGKGP